ncbi:MAG: M23 family metallopeptidase [Dehalococcoidia bacterium]|nr:M23 family metallopeptidase [Dehalococcoidia bacterium]
MLLAACSGGGSSPTGTRTREPAATQRTATPAPPDLTKFRGFIYPVKGACLPSSDNLMPNAPRAYRNGIHEGIDFYEVDSCTTIRLGTPVLAAKDGTVIRADTGYQDLTQPQLDALNTRIANGEANAPDIIDTLRGRQVWVDHGGGIVTRYDHLSAVASGIRAGSKVIQGQTIAMVGNSGTPESIADKKTVEMHLQFELRMGDRYLGQGLPPAEVRALYAALFTPLAP